MTSVDRIFADNGLPVDPAKIMRKIAWRLIPFLFLLYVFAYLDRVNVGYAALTIKRDLHFSNTVYGTGAGLFFISYALCQVPANIFLLRIGPRRWIGTILIAWGLISSSMPLVHTPAGFYFLRVLLGIAEAGFFPGIVLYLTQWFPAANRARAIAAFMTAMTISGVVGGPLSSVLLRLDGWLGIAGWKWLFVAEGLPSVALGFCVFRLLVDSPEQANWLDEKERTWLRHTLHEEESSATTGGADTIWNVLFSPLIWRLALIYFCLSVSFYIISLWLPLVFRSLTGGSDEKVLLLTAIPYLLATAAMLLVARSSDHTRERRWHLATCLLIAALGYGCSGTFHQPAIAITAIFVAAAGTWGCCGPFWSLPTSFLQGTAAASGIAFINTMGAVGGFCGPYLMGRISDATHSFHLALLAVAALLALAAILSLGIPAAKIERTTGPKPGAVNSV